MTIREALRLKVCITSIVLFSSTYASSSRYFVLQGIDKTQPDDVLTAPRIEGFTIRVSWQKIHDEGFAWLDEQIARGDEHNLDIQLRIMAGKWAPANLPGVSYFEYIDPDDPLIARAPIPWDAAMQQHWQSLAAEIGDRYAGNERIIVAHVPSFAESSEMHMPNEVTLLPGYSSRTLAESWLSLAEPLAAALPNAIVSLNYATPTQSQIEGEDSDWLRDELASLSGDQAGIQANDLSAKVTLDRNKYQTIVDEKELGRHVGFQMLSRSDAERFGGEFEEAVATGLGAGAEWFEIYADDVNLIPIEGDYNLNGIVDATDYVLWRKTIGQTAVNLAADGDKSGNVDSDDYELWRRRFGATASASVAGQFAGSVSTLRPSPEPATLYSLTLGLACFAKRWRFSSFRGT